MSERIRKEGSRIRIRGDESLVLRNEDPHLMVRTSEWTRLKRYTSECKGDRYDPVPLATSAFAGAFIACAIGWYQLEYTQNAPEQVISTFKWLNFITLMGTVFCVIIESIQYKVKNKSITEVVNEMSYIESQWADGGSGSDKPGKAGDAPPGGK